MDSPQARNLYQQLGLDRSASTEQLRANLREARDREVARGWSGGVDAARLELIDRALEAFATDASRRAYDESIAPKPVIEGPKPFDVWLDKARALLKSGDPGAAHAAIARARQEDADNPDALLEEARIYLYESRLAKDPVERALLAERAERQASEAFVFGDTAKTFAALLLRGDIALQLGDEPKASRWYRSALAAPDVTPPARLELAFRFVNLSKDDAQRIDRCLEGLQLLDPSDAATGERFARPMLDAVRAELVKGGAGSLSAGIRAFRKRFSAAAMPKATRDDVLRYLSECDGVVSGYERAVTAVKRKNDERSARMADLKWRLGQAKERSMAAETSLKGAEKRYMEAREQLSKHGERPAEDPGGLTPIIVVLAAAAVALLLLAWWIVGGILDALVSFANVGAADMGHALHAIPTTTWWFQLLRWGTSLGLPLLGAYAFMGGNADELKKWDAEHAPLEESARAARSERDRARKGRDDARGAVASLESQLKAQGPVASKPSFPDLPRYGGAACLR